MTTVPRTNFRSPYPRRLHIKFSFDWPSGFGEEDEIVYDDDDGRTDAGSTGILKAHLRAFGLGELKIISPELSTNHKSLLSLNILRPIEFMYPLKSI